MDEVGKLGGDKCQEGVWPGIELEMETLGGAS